MLFKKLSSELKSGIQKKADKSQVSSMKRYFRETINPIGVKHPVIRKITMDFYKLHKEELDFKTTVDICENLLKTGVYEFGIAAFNLFQKHEKEFDKNTALLIEKWISKYVSNWAFCDILCPKSMGFLISHHPSLINTLKKWAVSKNLWLRRASIVSFVIISRKKDCAKEVIPITKLLLNDKEDLVHKATGWTLREAAKANKPAILAFLRKHKLKLPRTALRYAIEHFSDAEKKELMKT